MQESPQLNDRRALLQQAMQALDEMQARLDAVEQAKTEPIAIVGMSCRFPGDANSPEAYWNLLCNGVDAISECPPERLTFGASLESIQEPSSDKPIWYGGFLNNIDQFDPQFFGISPREAVTMDPQQRLALEVSWEALERAGIAPESLMGSLTGVFLGVSAHDYSEIVRAGSANNLDGYAATGGSLNVAAGRIAFTLGLQGPCMALDTACSSSLVAVHLACQSLRSRESNLALAGGVNAVLLTDGFVAFNTWGMMASDGRCKTFDAAADGFVRSEGCGMIVLKRLSDAMADGDTVLAVIRGSAVNQDGRSSGLTVPNGPAQQAMMRQALASAGIEPAAVQYVEAHGTGTAIGDPIEVEALGAVLGQGRTADQPLVLASVKTNIGHLESASGIAGMIKVVLAMLHGAIPPHLHLRERSPKIPWPDFPIIIPSEMHPWPGVDGQRIAGVTGFGFSGTNAHVLLESAPVIEHSTPTIPAIATPGLLVLSAKSEPALRALAGRFHNHLTAQPDLSLADICATAATGRSHFVNRMAVTADTTAQLSERLATFADGQTPVGLVQGRAARPRVAFLFTGQGAQYPGMARTLYQAQPAFRAALDHCAALLQPQLDRPLLDLLFDAADPNDRAHPLHQTAYTQPALFAIEYALAELWRSWGITPQAVLGHSVGEYVAAVLAGVFSLEDGLRLIVARGRLMQALPAGGAMAAIFASVEAVRAAVVPHTAVLDVAAINGPEHTVIAGAADAIAIVSAQFAEAGVRVQPLTVSHAFHSPLMEPMLAAFATVAASIRYSVPRLRLISNVSGGFADESVASADYWVRHVRAAVQFAAGMAALQAEGYDTFIEIGPHPVLLGMGQGCLPAGNATWLASLRRNRDDQQQILTSLGELYTHGARINWAAVAHGQHERLSLPTYPFQRQRYWADPPRRRKSTVAGVHPLLGRRSRSPLIRETLYEAQISADEPAWLADHRVYDRIIFPGSAYLELALAAGGNTTIVESLLIREALMLPEAGEIALQTIVSPEENGTRQIHILSVEQATDGEPGWKSHASGSVRTAPAALPAAPVDIEALATGFDQMIDTESYYQQLQSIGLTYGPAFRGLIRLMHRSGAALGLARLPGTANDGARYQIHPALLDSCFHVIGAAVATTLGDQNGDVFVPIAAEQLCLYQPGLSAVWCEATVLGEVQANATTVSVGLRLYNEAGAIVATIERLDLKRAPRTAWGSTAQSAHHDMLYSLAWRPLQRPDAVAAAGTWLILADTTGVGASLAQRLEAAGATCTLAVPGSITSEQKPGLWQIDATDPNAYATLLDRLPALDGIAYLCGLDAPDRPSTLDELQDGQAHVLRGALHLAQALATREELNARLLLITRGAQSIDGEPTSPLQAALWGMGRVIASEQPRLNCTCIDFDLGTRTVDEDLAAELLALPSENQIALRAGRRFVARLTNYTAPSALPDGQPYQLDLHGRGSLENLAFTALKRRTLQAGELEIEVRATGLNFRDVLNVLGMYPGDPGPPGLECAGIVSAVGAGVHSLQPGDRVVGIAPLAFNSYVITRDDMVVKVPEKLTFAEAATLPIAYLTAHFGLHHLAQLKPGERVLIHAAAGGVGMAAVWLAQQAGAEVFATVGSAEKRRFIESLGVRHIYSSRTLDFADQILADTAGAGVDIVLNALADEFIDRSFAVLAPQGRFLEIGKRGIWSHEQVAMLRPAASYYPYDLSDFLQGAPDQIHQALQTVVDAIATDDLQTLPFQAFPIEQISDAFRFMAQAHHIGKVVISHNSQAMRPQLIREDGCYLITGGLGGLGLQVARWLVAQGARHLALVGRRTPSPEAGSAIDQLRQDGADVLVLQGDIASASDVSEILAAIALTGLPLHGVIHAAGVLDDGMLAQQSWERFTPVLAPKVNGAWLLHQATRTLPLDFFVLFSSASALLGSAGQANYASANTFLDALAQRRHAEGLPALSINWGAWAEVGMAANLDEREQRRLSSRGMRSISPAVGTQALGALLRAGATQVALLPIDWPTLLAQLPADQPPPPLFAELAAQQASRHRSDAPAIINLREQLEAAAPHEQEPLIIGYLQQAVMQVLALPEVPTPSQPIGDLGMDSLMAVELKNRVERDVGVSLSVTTYLEGLPILELAAQIAGYSTSTSKRDVTPAVSIEQRTPDQLLAQIDQLSDDEVAALLNSLQAEQEIIE